MYYSLALPHATRHWFSSKLLLKRKSIVQVSKEQGIRFIMTDFYIIASETDLFRKTSITTRLLAVFAKNYGSDYVRSVLQPVFQKLIEKPPEEKTFELDPSKAGPGEDVTKNKQNVVNATEMILNAICASANDAPK